MLVLLPHLIEAAISEFTYSLGWNYIQLETGLHTFVKWLHERSSVHALTRHTLVPELQIAISPRLVKHHQVHNLLALRVIEHRLGLARDAVGQVERAQDHASTVREELEDSWLHLVLGGSWGRVVHGACDLEAGAFAVRELPLSSKLKVVSKGHKSTKI